MSNATASGDVAAGAATQECFEIADPPKEDAGQGISVIEAASMLVRGNLGPGCLALPFAFAQAGWLYGSVVLALTMAQGLYAMMLLAQCRHDLAAYGVRSLGEVAEVALGARSRNVVQLFLVIVQGGVCCVYIDLVSENVLEMSENLGLDRLQSVMVVLPMFAMSTLLRSVSKLTSLSTLGNVAMGVACVAAAVSGAYALSLPQKSNPWHEAAAPRRGIIDLVQLAASTFYAFEGIGLVLPIENAMAVPSQFRQAMLIASFVLTLAYVSVGVLCGVAFRSQIDSGSITAFLAERASGTNSEWALVTVNVLVTITVLITFPLQLLPAAEIVEQYVKHCCTRSTSDAPMKADAECGRNGPPPQTMGIQDVDTVCFNDGVTLKDVDNRASVMCLPSWLLQRLCMVLLFGCVTLLVSNVALLVSLFGAVGQAGLGALAPLSHLVLMCKKTAPWSYCVALVDILILAFCSVVMVVGTWASLVDIAHSFA